MVNHNMVKTKEAAKYEKIEILTYGITYTFLAADLSNVEIFEKWSDSHELVVSITTMEGKVHRFEGPFIIHTVEKYIGE